MINIEQLFDEILYQFSKGISYENYNKGQRWIEFEKIKEWKSKFGYNFNIYSNDHLINNKPHFHFDNKEKEIYTKIDFYGNVLESLGNDIPKKILKDLEFFLTDDKIQKIISEKWNERNPNFMITNI